MSGFKIMFEVRHVWLVRLCPATGSDCSTGILEGSRVGAERVGEGRRRVAETPREPGELLTSEWTSSSSSVFCCIHIFPSSLLLTFLKDISQIRGVCLYLKHRERYDL